MGNYICNFSKEVHVYLFLEDQTTLRHATFGILNGNQNLVKSLFFFFGGGGLIVIRHYSLLC